MDTDTKIILVFLAIIAFGFASYGIARHVKDSNVSDNMNLLCKTITDEKRLRLAENNDTGISDVYCYYSGSYAPPSDLNKTKFLCACDFKLNNGSIIYNAEAVLGSG